MATKQELLRQIPKTDLLLARPALAAAAAEYGEAQVAYAARRVLADIRADIMEGGADVPPSLDVAEMQVLELLLHQAQPRLRRVINATGVPLHTNLGRAPLAKAAAKAAAELAAAYSTLEYDVAEGARGDRQALLAGLLARLAGAEDAIAVCNNAGGVLLMLAALAAGRQVPVSRGELVEIGGSFRVPEIMGASGARLVEVGTTNRTHLSDYEKAICPQETGALLKVHTSNYRVMGFTHSVSLEQLVELGQRRGLPVLYDLGGGALLPLEPFGIQGEPCVAQALAAGVDLISFSADKLLGGPQAGIIAGQRELIAKLKAHPLARALRPGKLTLAALEATLRLYLDADVARREVPVLRMLGAAAPQLQQKAQRLLLRLGALPTGAASVVPSNAPVGGGCAPLHQMEGYAVALESADANKLEAALRAAEVPLITRISQQQVLLDVRTIEEDEFELVAQAVGAAFGGGAT